MSQRLLMAPYLRREPPTTSRASAFPTPARRKRCKRWCCTVSGGQAHLRRRLPSRLTPPPPVSRSSPSKAPGGSGIPDSSSAADPGQRVHPGAGLRPLFARRRRPWRHRSRLSVSKRVKQFSVSAEGVGGTLKPISSFRFVCCVMVAIPLAATLFTAIIRWRRNKEVSPSPESSCLRSDLNLYGTAKTNGPSGCEPAPFTMEENSNGSSPKCQTVLEVPHTPTRCSPSPQTAPVEAGCTGGSRPSLYKQPARASSAPLRASEAEATPPSTASVSSACCGL